MPPGDVVARRENQAHFRRPIKFDAFSRGLASFY